MKFLAALLFSLQFLFVVALGASEHFSLELPSAPKNIDHALRSGYIEVDSASSRHLFYVFAESRKQPVQEQPLVLWVNGGPGCSSMKGFFMGNGPFIPNSDGKTLRSNPYSWNNIANVVYVDSPAGVGFSYSENEDDLTNITDARTASDTRKFLVEFLKEYPQFKNSELWLTSQSYGGHYVPVLAEDIIHHNDGKSPSDDDYLNLKGVMVGNPLIDTSLNMPMALHQWEVNAVIPHGTADALDAVCDFSDPDYYIKLMTGQNAECFSTFIHYLGYVENMDIYDLFADVCTEDLKDTKACGVRHLTEYMNLEQVQQAFKARKPLEWTDCFNIDYSLEQYRSSMPSIQTMLDNELDVLIYSGDVDGSTPYWTTIEAFKQHGLPVVEPMQPYLFNGQVAGRIIKYEGLQLVTVRNAGHLVPWTQPERCYLVFSNFLTKSSIPKESTSEDLENVGSTETTSSETSDASSIKSGLSLCMFAIGLFFALY